MKQALSKRSDKFPKLAPSLKPYAAIVAAMIIAIGGGVVLAADNFGSVVNFHNSAGDTVLGSVVDGVGDFQSLEIQSTALASSHLSDTANIATLSGTQTFTGDKTFSGTIDFAANSIPIDDLSVGGASTDNIIAYNGTNVVWTTPAAVSLPQALDTTDSPTFAGETLTGLTASRLVATDGSKGMASVANLASWIAGTSNQITVTDDTDGTITLTTPQSIGTGSSVTFSEMISQQAAPRYRHYESDGSTDNKRWTWYVNNSALRLELSNDANNSGAEPIVFTRSGNALTSIAMAATNITYTGAFGLTGALTASGDGTFNGGDLTVGSAAAGNIGTTTNPNQWQFLTATTAALEGSLDVGDDMTIGGTIADDGISGNSIDLNTTLGAGVEVASGASATISVDGGTYDLYVSSAGFARLPKAASDPTGEAGAIYYNTASNVIRWHNGSAWANL